MPIDGSVPYGTGISPLMRFLTSLRAYGTGAHINIGFLLYELTDLKNSPSAELTFPNPIKPQLLPFQPKRARIIGVEQASGA
jgi:hypothetical protein